MYRRSITIVLTVVALVLLLVAPASATHNHCLTTPNGASHQVAHGQTALAEGHGGWHRYHDNVHKGAADRVTGVLGKDHARVTVWVCANP